MNAFDVTTCVRFISLAAWARLAGPVVQFSTTGSLPARYRPRNAMSQATDAGSSRPTFGAGSFANRFDMASAPTSIRS